MTMLNELELKRIAEYKVLEEEFEYLHYKLGPEYPHDKTAVEREEELRKRVHALERDGKEPRTALCLSGGGIRSATFSLGVLQGLAQKGLLDKFHYLSTVSGGGYIGSWLSSWIHHSSLKSVKQKLSAPQKSVSPEPEPIRRLRAYSNYLSPVWGLSIDFLTLVATFLRNLILNWSVFIPLLAAASMLPRLYLAALGWQAAEDNFLFWLLSVAVLMVVTGIAYTVSDLPGTVDNKKKPANEFSIFCFSPIFCAAVLLSWIGIWYAEKLNVRHWCWFWGGGAAVHLAGVAAGLVWRRARGIQLQRKKLNFAALAFVLLSGAVGGGILRWVTNLDENIRKTIAFHELYTTISVPVLLCCYWLAAIIYTGIARKISSEDDREWWARSGAWWLGASVVWIIVCALVIYGPQCVLNLPWLSHSAGPESLGVGGGILGIITGLIGYWSKNGATLKQRAKGIAAATGLRLLDFAAIAFTIILLLTVSYAVSWGLIKTAHLLVASQNCIDSSRESNVIEELNKYKLEASQVKIKPNQTITPEEAAKATELAGKAAEASSKAVKAEIEAIEVAASAQALFTNSIEALKKAIAFSSSAAEMAAKASEVSAAQMQPPKAGQSQQSQAYVFMLHRATPLTLSILFILLSVVGIGMSFFIGANTFSMHSLYGNRLVRAYLGATREERHPHWFTGFDPADNISMKDLKASADSSDNSRKNRLFHVVNIALNMVKPSDGRLEWQQRKAASFTVSPLYSGSASVGFQPTASYSGEEGVSLGRAMAISGAAASPNMGYHTSPLVAFVMTFFNIRLGWWLPNPGPRGHKKWSLGEPPLGFIALIKEALVRTTDNSPYVYLSDGGHFENLALYEMVKRRCHRIVLVDAGCDPRYTFEDLENAIRKIRTDTGISITFPTGLPTQQNASKSNRHIAIGTVSYSDVDGNAENGRIIYIKPVMSGDEPLDVKRYRAINNKPGSPFPHQSTADQFFDEAQFESYRMLGYHSVMTGFAGNDWPEQGQDSKKEYEGDPETIDPAQRGSASAGGVFSGISDVLQSMGRGALIASAITVGGVVGVTGTVALKDATVALKPGAEVSIKKEDRELLKQGLPLNISVPPDWGGDLKTQVERLVKAANDLSSKLEKTQPTAPNDPELAERIRELDTVVKKLVDELPKILKDAKLAGIGTINKLGKINVVLEEVRDALGNDKDNSNPGSVRKKLDTVIRHLNALNPRGNISAVDKGGSR